MPKPEKPEKPSKPPKPPKPDKVVVELADPTAAAQALSAGEAGLG